MQHPVFVFPVVSLMAFALSGCGPGVSPSSTPESLAITACQEFSKRQLLSPSSVEYPHDREHAVSHTGNRYTVRAYLDAKNAFGVMIRSRYTCTVGRDSQGNWRLETFALVR
jgi:hypothetical protein